MITMRTTPLTAGEPAPWFTCRTKSNRRYTFDTVGGRYIVLSFLGSAADPGAVRLLEAVRANRRRFDDERISFFGVSVDAEDERSGRLADAVPGIRFFFDLDRSVSGLYGATLPDGGYRLLTYVLDPLLRVCAVLDRNNGNGDEAAALMACLDGLPRLAPARLAHSFAPVLVLANIFEPELCRNLVGYYETHGGEPTGFMRDVDGRTVMVIDDQHKRRRDRDINDHALRQACMARVRTRLVPEIHKAFQFKATRMERYIVSCYDGDEGGHFRPHRDNTTKGTAHRRFAVSLFLNSGDYEGGHLRFPEFGTALYTAPVGGAVVFSCSLLHEATPVTRGRRYMFLPFLYDERARELRHKNLPFLVAKPAIEDPAARMKS